MKQQITMWSRRGALLLGILLVACSAQPPAAHHGHSHSGQHASASQAVSMPIEETPSLDLGGLSDLQGLIPELAEKRVVYVGETHTSYEHHLMQLEIIKRLHERHPRLAIGMEFFQQPFQDILDQYVAGELDEQELLAGTEYYSRWRYDYRLYAPILRYAREHKLPLVALNLPRELTTKAGRLGLDELTDEEKQSIPNNIDYSDEDYERRVRQVYDQHPNHGQSFSNFLLVQLLWDEGMADRAASWLVANPDYRMVVLAGSGHLAYGSGIPQRVNRRLPVSSAIVLNNWEATLEAGLADFLLMPEKRKLPPVGKIGALLNDGEEGLKVSSCLPDSPCESAGIRKGDRFVSINGAPVSSMPELRLATWDKSPGDVITLNVIRERWFSTPQELTYELELQ